MFQSVWLRRVGLVAAEHSLFALSSLLLHVLLARWLTGQEYGSYALAYSLLLLIITFHNSLLTEPLLIHGGGRYAAGFSPYLAILLRGHWVSTGAVAVALAAAGAAFAAAGGAWALAAPVCWGLAVAVPCVTLFRLLRRACYARLKPLPSVLSGGLYMLLLLGGVVTLHVSGALTPFSTLIVLGAASLSAGLWLKSRLPDVPAAEGGGRRVGAREVLKTHWAYGRWATGANLLWWVPLNSLVVLLPAWRGLEDGATLRALVNLILPLLQVNVAFGTIILPALAAAAPDARRFSRMIGTCLMLFCGAALCYYGVLFFAGERLLHWVYGGGYDHSAGALLIVGLAALLDAAAVVLSCALRAQNRPGRIFAAYLCSAATAIVAGYLWSERWGVAGAASAMVLSFAVAGVMLAAPLVMSLLAGGRGEVGAGAQQVTPAVEQAVYE